MPAPRFALPAICFLVATITQHAFAQEPVQAAERRPRSAATSVAVAPSPFSPNGDGRMDVAIITVEVDLPATVRIEVIGPADAARRTWVEAAAPGSPARVVWDGRADDGGGLADGAYVVRASGAGPADLADEATAPVVLDTVSPSFRWLGVRGGGARERLSFRFATKDASDPIDVRAVVENEEGTRAELTGRVRDGVTRLIWSSGRPFPGNYRVRFELRDAVGNAAETRTLAFRVERPAKGKVWTHVPNAGRRVALTIDDCHFPDAWARILRVLRDRDAGATFFCPGTEMRQDPQLVKRTIRDGHAIGSHGWDHANLSGMSSDGVMQRLRADARALWTIGRRTTAPYMRPPEGAFTPATIQSSGAAGHPRVVMWDVDTGDWTSPGVSTIVSRAVDRSEPGSIILLHTKSQTAAALPAIISGLRERGLEPVGLPELFAAARKRG